MISADGGMGEEVAHRVFEGRKVWRKIAKLWKENIISREVKRGAIWKSSGPTVLYDYETWSLSTHEKRKIEVFEMMCLRNICGIRRADRVRNSIIRERCGCELSVLEIIESNMLKWFIHVERMGEERLVKSVYRANVMWRVTRGEGDRREDGVMK